MTKAALKAKVAAKKAAMAPLRPLDQALANDRELSARVSENADRVKARMKALRSNNAYEQRRRDSLADRDIFQEIQMSLRDGHIVRLTGSVPPPVNRGIRARVKNTSHRIELEEADRIKACEPIGIIKRSQPVHIEDWTAIKKIDRARRQRGQLEKVMWVPHWDHTGDHLKSLAWSMAIWENGGEVMTVNILENVIDAAHRDTRGFAAHMRERLKRELTKVATRLGCPPVEFFFVVEATELGSPHLHGGITLPTDAKHRHAVRTALYEASHGKDVSRTKTGREVDLRTYETPAIWANYAGKWVRGSSERLDGRVFAATSGIRGMGKDWYTRMRASGEAIGGHELDDDLIVFT